MRAYIKLAHKKGVHPLTTEKDHNLRESNQAHNYKKGRVTDAHKDILNLAIS